MKLEKMDRHFIVVFFPVSQNVPQSSGAPGAFKMTVLDACDRIKEEFVSLQTDYRK